jgi:hypothetical protein
MNMKKYIKIKKVKQTAVAVSLLCLVMSSCSKMNDLHESYMTGDEQIYAARVDYIEMYPGKYRTLLKAKISSQRINTARIYWNDYRDSIDIDVKDSIGTFTVEIGGLEEREYIFHVVCFDKFGYKSLPVEVTGRVYGDKFKNRLVNRGIQDMFCDEKGLSITWNSAPEYAIYSEMEYKDENGQIHREQIPTDTISSLIPEWAEGFRYRTLFIPDKNSVDTFDIEWKTGVTILRKYPRTGWTADSRGGFQYMGEYIKGDPICLFDGISRTCWQTKLNSEWPQCLTADMKKELSILTLRIFPGVKEQRVSLDTIQVFISNTPITPDERQPSWGEPVCTYKYRGGDMAELNLLPNSKGQYLVLYFPSNNNKPDQPISLREMEVYGEEKSDW